MTAFFVTTNGQSASKWLAGRLHAHPSVACSHSPAALPLSTKAGEYTPADMASILQQEKARKAIPLDRLIEELEDHYPEAEHVGNVHHFNLRQLDANRRAHPPARAIVVVDLVRHPLDLVRSSTANMTRQATHNEARLAYLRAVRERNQALYDTFEGRYGLSADDIPTLAFMAACMTLFSLRVNLDIEAVDGRVRMESLTTERGAFAELFAQLTGMVPEASYLDSVFATGRTNRHQKRGTLGHAEVYAGWEPWQRALYDHMAEVTDIERGYEELGYRFTFRG